MIYFEKFTYAIFCFVFTIAIAVDSFVFTIAINSLVIAIAVDSFVLEMEVALAIISSVLTLLAGGCVAVEDKEEREAEKPKGWFQRHQLLLYKTSKLLVKTQFLYCKLRDYLLILLLAKYP